MKKNLYYRTVFKRKNIVKDFLLNLFLALSSWPRMLLEVFLRKNFGERYFSIATVITLFVALSIFPFLAFGPRALFNSNMASWENWGEFLLHFSTWLAFAGAFLYFGLKRNEEVKRNPSVYDFKRFSLHTGTIDPIFFRLGFLGEKPSVRLVEIVYEPAVCLLPGIALVILGQWIGIVIILCSIFYCLGYAGAYYQGDHFVMDKIDEMICNEEMFDSFVEGKDASETRGFRFYGRRPAKEDIRRKVVETFIADDEPVFEVS
jgi:hypothetical protein